MTEEEKKAIEFNLKQVGDSYELHGSDWAKNAINETLNLIQSQQKEIEKLKDKSKIEHMIKTSLYNQIDLLQKEIEKKDKIIDEMAEELSIQYNSCEPCELSEKAYIICKNYKNCEECIKQYFEKKVEGK